MGTIKCIFLKFPGKMKSIHIICNANGNSSSYTETNLLLKQETVMSLLFILLNPTERCLATIIMKH